MGLDDLKILAISDTHLGEDSSLLSYPHGRQHLWKVLRDTLGEGKRFSVEELVLLGDIPDRALASTSQIYTNTKDFVETMGSAARIKKGIYVIGNHDHTIWTQYRQLCGKPSFVTDVGGDSIIVDGRRRDHLASVKYVDELLSMFFGYPGGGSWRGIRKQESFSFSIANPLYATKVKDRTYAFAHGTHFKRETTIWAKMERLGERFIDTLIEERDLSPSCDIGQADSLEALEKAITPFVDCIWSSSRDKTTGKRDQLWHWVTELRERYISKRGVPDESAVFSRATLPDQKRISHLEPGNESIQLWQRYFRPLMERSLPEGMKNLTFVYGDTHKGGWGELDDDIRIYNCGGWVAYGKEDHPRCHIFAVDLDGNEYLLDVSFKDVEVDEKPLLELAAEEAEHRRQ
jgi:hypothetical protein